MMNDGWMLVDNGLIILTSYFNEKLKNIYNYTLVTKYF
jgi:hypothetical protein